MIRNDLHIHSIQSDGMHTLFEIVEIAASKGMRLVNISDHGTVTGKMPNFGILNNRERTPKILNSKEGVEVRVLAGIEANILNIEGDSDFPVTRSYWRRFDIVSAGFHSSAKKLKTNYSIADNTLALENYIKRFPLDIIVHPCEKSFPLNIDHLVKLAVKNGFALEVNNVSLRSKSTDLKQLKKMITLAKNNGALLVESSDGHTFYEIGENEKITSLLEDMGLNGDDLFLNRSDNKLDNFILKRNEILRNHSIIDENI